MPIKVQRDLPVREELEKENIFVMDDDRAGHQDIRPIKIGILNLMPLKEDTELQLLRSLSNTSLQIDVTFVAVQSHESTHTSMSHLNKFYQNFDAIKDEKFDGFIVTGAPVEHLEFEEVDYWAELCEIMEWADKNVTSTIYICWGAQAALYHFYGVKKHLLPKKMFGIYPHNVMNRKIPLVRGFDDVFFAPHSRHTGIDESAVDASDDLMVLAKSEEAGYFLLMGEHGKRIFITGHPEYDRMTLDKEYNRDKNKGLDIEVPFNYYPDDNPENKPNLQWRSTSNAIYSNWLNYYVYQVTPFDLYGTPEALKSK